MSSAKKPTSRGEKSPLLTTRRPTTNSDKDDIETATSSAEEYGTTISQDDDAEVEVAGAPRDDRIENWQVAVNLIKGSIGTGILGLPLAIKHAGIAIGPAMLGFMGILSLHNMHLLVICSRTMAKREHVSGRMDYGELTNIIFSHYGGAWKKFASRLVNFFLVLVQLGFCCVYILFVADNIYRISGKILSIRAWAAISLPAFLGLSYIDHLKFISYISIVANFLALYGLAGVLADVLPLATNPANLPQFNTFSNFALSFGQAVFAFEGIGVILPVEKKAKKPKDFVPVMYGSIIFVVMLYVLVGLFGYLAYGDDIKGSVTLNLTEKPFHMSVQAVYAAAIYCTYFIQFYVPMTILIPWIRERAAQYQRFADLLFRTVCVVATFGVAVGVPQLGNSIALVGSLAGSAVLFVFPALLHILVIWEDRSSFVTKLHVFKNICIMVMGVIGAFVGTFEAIRAIAGDHHNISPAQHKPDGFNLYPSSNLTNSSFGLF